MRTEFTTQAPGPSPHAYNDPDLSPIEFLHAVMRAQHQPMAIRIEAAKAFLPFTSPYPRPANSFPRCTIVIGGIPDDCARAADHGSVAHSPDGSPEQINEKSQSFSDFANNSHQPQLETPGPTNIETKSYPPTLIDYSKPPTAAELQEIKAAINALRPDLAHLPVPEPRFCECGHWVFGYYSCCSAASRKLN